MKEQKKGERKHLLKFIDSSPAFDNNAKLKLFLFLSEAKPNTYIRLRITKNLHDKHEFERLLKLNGITYNAGSPKGFEEIVSIKDAAVWRFTGTWHGYDLFGSRFDRSKFERYKMLLRQQKHAQADTIAGELYGYPACCFTEFIRQHNPDYLMKYTYHQFYKQLHESDKKFPFITHVPCSPACRATARLNKKYRAAVKKTAPRFYKEYTKKRTYTVPIIVDIENESLPNKEKKAHDYVVITKKPIERKYRLISWLTTKQHQRGEILDAKLTLQYDYAQVDAKRKTGKIDNFHHERKFPGENEIL